ncbi:ABC transporter ATP-binding protein [Streptomyces chilikensis]|uniref:ABC transporter ATP-binding protein n=1 Tax=Streptomyces chilikensis TaxID=1194079 RepID=UPI00140BF075|nr:ATP-binding cassette domain-containing protein [Streptomyces chilikensis]
MRVSRQGDGPPPGPGVVARGLGVKGPRGWAFRDVTFEAEPGALVAVTGPSGSGRTALLLTLTGRMRPAEGSARVAGLALPKRMAEVRRVTGVAHVPGVTDLDPALTVAEHLRERALVGRRYGGPAADVVRGLLRSPRARAAGDAARAEEALRTAGLDPADLPKGGRTAVRDLSRAQELRLSVALALLGRPGRPAAVAVDDADLGLSADEREDAVALLSSLAASGTTVLAAFREAPPEAGLVVSTAAHGDPDRERAPQASRPGPLARLTRRRAPGDRGADAAADAAPAPSGRAADAETAVGADEDKDTEAAEDKDTEAAEDEERAGEARTAEEDADAHAATGRA